MSCPECVKGSGHTGTPKGTEIKVGDVDAYATGPEDALRIIVVGHDIFGWKFVNTRLLADEYAGHGFRVLVPDLFKGAWFKSRASTPSKLTSLWITSGGNPRLHACMCATNTRLAPPDMVINPA